MSAVYQTDEQVVALLPVVHRIATKMAKTLPSFVSRDDLVSFGTMGLLDAVRRFDPQKGVKLETFITWRIRGAILDGLRDLDPVPRQIREYAREMDLAYSTVESRMLRTAMEDEICEYLGITESEFHKRRYDISRCMTLSLDLPLDDCHDMETSFANILVDSHSIEPEEWAVKQELIQTIADVVEQLPKKEKLVISLYYYEELAFREIAELLGLTVSRISQLHSKAMGRLRQTLAGKMSNIELD